MKSERILEMIRAGEIEELKGMLQDEIYISNLGGSSEKKRYSAMKRYLKLNCEVNPMFQKPCKVTFEGDNYYSFIDGVTIALTSEGVGQLEEYDNSNDNYFKIDKLIDFTNTKTCEKLDINSILADAKSKGYKYCKDEVVNNDKQNFLLNYKDAYYKIGLLDKAYSIIANSEEAEVYYTSPVSPLIIKNSIGIVIVLPIRLPSVNDSITVITLQ